MDVLIRWDFDLFFVIEFSEIFLVLFDIKLFFIFVFDFVLYVDVVYYIFDKMYDNVIIMGLF